MFRYDIIYISINSQLRGNIMSSNNTCSMQIFKDAVRKEALERGLNPSDSSNLLNNFSTIVDTYFVNDAGSKNSPVNKELALRLLKESSLTTGKFEPNEAWWADKSLGVTLNGEPIIGFGYYDDEKTSSIIDSLLNNPDFINIIEYFYGDATTLRKEVIEHKPIFEKTKMTELPAILASEQGQVEEGEENTDSLVEAVVFTDNHAIPYALCITNSVMLDMKPQSTPLSHHLRLAS